MLLGRSGGRSGCGRIVGQVAGQADQLLVSARGLSKADPLAELLERQPALADRVTQQRDASLALGIEGEDRRRPGLRGIAHLRHRTAGVRLLGSLRNEQLANADESPWLARKPTLWADCRFVARPSHKPNPLYEFDNGCFR